jgi:hypothetical protein
MNLKGKVHSIKTTDYFIEETDTVSFPNNVYYFNKKGLIDSLETFGEISPHTYTITRYIYNDKSVLINTVKNIYEDGQWNNYTVTDWRRRKYFYNSEGVLVKIKEVNADTVLTREIKYKYDDLGRLEKLIDNDIDESNLEVTIWTYNANGSFSNLTSTRHNHRGVSYFDKEGAQVKSQWTRPIKSKEFTEYKNSWEKDSHGNWIHEITTNREVKPTIDEVKWATTMGAFRTITYYE